MKKLDKRVIPSFVIVCVDLLILISIPSQVKVYQEGIVNTRFVPYLLTILILLCGVTDIVKTWLADRKKGSAEAETDKKSRGKAGYIRVAASVAGIALWLVLVPELGFVLATVLLSAGIMLLAGNKSWIQIFLVSVILTLSVYCVFKLALNLRLPQGLFFF